MTSTFSISAPPHSAAGCVITDGNHILAGFQPHKKTPGISGFGGHKEGVETFLETAYRETIEELYNIPSYKIPFGLVSSLVSTLKPSSIRMKDEYVMVFLTFQEFELFLKICKTSGIESPLFSKLPLTLSDAIHKRACDSTAEISHLCLLPIVPYSASMSFVSWEFLEDIWQIART